MTRAASVCEVLLNTQACEHPPEMEGAAPVRTRCYGCGARACRACSRLRRWLGRRCRVCNDCAGEYQP